MNDTFDLQKYLTEVVERVVAEAIKATKEAMNSPLFKKLREDGYLLEDHDGGCILYEKRELVEKLINA